MATVVPSEAAVHVPATITLDSPAFRDGELMAQRYTCDGTDASPPLRWSGIPDGTAELVLTVEDPDAADQTFVHWMVSGLRTIEPGALEEDHLPEGAVVGLNDFGAAGYDGPCPQHGHEAHHYVFTLMAVGVSLGLTHRFTAVELRDALEGNVLARGELVGRYGRTDLTGPAPPAYTG